MLKRIFWATLSTGVLCTFALAAVSPAVGKFLESWNAETNIGIFDSVKALYVLIPLAVAVVSRVFLLHDRISDLLGLRRRFDIENILKPLAEGVGLPTTDANWKQIEENRDLAMTRTFYRYASFRDPKIDGQLVRSAADRWAWFWCTIEPQIILVITGVIFVTLGAWTQLLGLLAIMWGLILISLLLWPMLRAGARSQTGEILNSDSWKIEVRSAFVHLGGQALGSEK